MPVLARAPGGDSHRLPVGRPIYRASETLLLDKALQHHHRMPIFGLPVRPIRPLPAPGSNCPNPAPGPKARLKNGVLLAIIPRLLWRCSADQPINRSRSWHFQAAAPNTRHAKARPWPSRDHVLQVLADRPAKTQIMKPAQRRPDPGTRRPAHLPPARSASPVGPRRTEGRLRTPSPASAPGNASDWWASGGGRATQSGPAAATLPARCAPPCPSIGPPHCAKPSARPTRATNASDSNLDFAPPIGGSTPGPAHSPHGLARPDSRSRG